MQIFGLGAGIVYDIALRIGIVLLVLAIIDYVSAVQASSRT